MMYPSHPFAKNGDQYYLEPALGAFPQYVEPALAGDGDIVGLPKSIVIPALLVIGGLLFIPAFIGEKR